MDKSLNRFKNGTKYVNIVSAVTRDELTSLNNRDDHFNNNYLNSNDYFNNNNHLNNNNYLTRIIQQTS